MDVTILGSNYQSRKKRRTISTFFACGTPMSHSKTLGGGWRTFKSLETPGGPTVCDSCNGWTVIHGQNYDANLRAKFKEILRGEWALYSDSF